jgi:hypothetical protein
MAESRRSWQRPPKQRHWGCTWNRRPTTRLRTLSKRCGGNSRASTAPTRYTAPACGFTPRSILNLQRAATQAVLDGTAAYERRHGWKGHLENVVREGVPLEDYKHPDWSQTLTDNGYFHGLVTSTSPARITVKLGRTECHAGARRLGMDPGHQGN